PLNELVDHPGYYLVQSPEAFEIVQEVASPHVQVVFDIYHQQISEGNVLANLRRHLERGHIGHLHAAGNPGRHELQRGELHYRSILSAIKETGYTGYVGLEYWPADEDPLPALREVAGWMRDG
ncbi:MAG: TIM barrel protein, partial [Verrucomicrobiota bacterium]